MGNGRVSIMKCLLFLPLVFIVGCAMFDEKPLPRTLSLTLDAEYYKAYRNYTPFHVVPPVEWYNTDLRLR